MDNRKVGLLGVTGIASAIILCITAYICAYTTYAQVTVTASVLIYTAPQCSDGIDNDGDMKIDYPVDPGCASASDGDETDPPPIPMPSPTPNQGGGGGGGGGSKNQTNQPGVPTQAIFRGKAYPGSSVHVLKNTEHILTTSAGPDANFQAIVTGLQSGPYTFSVWAESAQKNKSLTQTYNIYITPGVSTIISGIFFPPTISLDKTEVKRGDVLTIIGQTIPQAPVSIFFNSEQEIVKGTISDEDGGWIYQLNTNELLMGDHSSRARTTDANTISQFSKVAFFKVGTQNTFAIPAVLKGDLNYDQRVNLVDFSIAAYWYKRQLSGDIIQKDAERLNGDGKMDLTDFSIMAYYWTG
ncbi:hypothetical protein A2755_00315 [Candidatus Wolfebacteria bacterium RIFCSPHIGHO2_01_FULL_48_22]|uniref:Dockerin domain-containing protein n=1 Tax=Candidatus Wolfebacteria bacterium RIFCSPHIGHO2_01_FULL_48_22 TaxID=1802555 RepID=A0A1F8DVT4_9BACT|nr:MAG: hypothetical protein A2755_00315 [Candidatus Wolfebacteria bacterium RIFCSPHIGHO2_01_FULL_48_22]